MLRHTQLNIMSMNVEWMASIIKIVNHNLDDFVVAENHSVGIQSVR